MADETVEPAVTPMVVEQMDEMPDGVAPQRVALFGVDGLGVSAISLTTDSTGKVTGGTWTDTKSGSHSITVTMAES